MKRRVWLLVKDVLIVTLVPGGTIYGGYKIAKWFKEKWL
jgi:hypothetical protein